MSFILDALKKSEAERQRQAGPALLEMRIVRPTRRLPVWAIVTGAVLCGCVLALAFVALRRSGFSAAPPPPAAAAAAPAAPGTANGATTAVPATASPPVASAPPANAPAVSEAATGETAVTPGTVTVAPTTISPDDNPADAAPAVAPPAGVARERADARGLRNYAELGGTMPELRLDLHVYATKPAERYALINMHTVHEGEVTPEGVVVKEITPEGVVLEYHGTEFLLGR